MEQFCEISWCAGWFKLNWSKNCMIVVNKATKSLYRSMFGCSCVVKCAAYKTIMCPMLEHSAFVWNFHNLEMFNFQSPCTNVQLNGSVEASGVYLAILGPFPQWLLFQTSPFFSPIKKKFPFSQFPQWHIPPADF